MAARVVDIVCVHTYAIGAIMNLIRRNCLSSVMNATLLLAISVAGPTALADGVRCELTKELGAIQLNSRASAFAAHGDTAFVAFGYESIAAIDISDPSAPTLLQTLQLPANANEWISSLTVSGQYLYALAGQYILTFDITDPANMAFVGLELREGRRGIAIRDTLGYIAMGPEGLHIVDVSEPNLLFQYPMIAQFDPESEIDEVILEGPIAYLIGTRNQSERVILSLDITDPANPTQLGFYAYTGATQVKVHNAMAYINRGQDGLLIVDFSNPAQPKVLRGYPELTGAIIAVTGDKLYLSTDAHGVTVVDISDIKAPQSLGLTGSWTSELPIGFDGQLAYFQTFDLSLRLYDTTTLAESGVRLSEMSLHATDSLTHLVSDGTTAYVAKGFNKIDIIDVADPHQPEVLLNTIGDVSHVNSLALYADLLLAAGSYVGGGGAVSALDVSNPATPQVISTYQGPGFSSINIDKTTAYAASYTDGVHIIDMQDPASPQLIGIVPALGNALVARAQGPTLYIGEFPGNLRVVDVSTPSSPAVLADLQLAASQIQHIEIDNTRAWVSTSGSGVHVVDVQNPSAPTEIAHLMPDTNVKQVIIDGDLAYVIAERAQTILDISDLASPVIIGINEMLGMHTAVIHHDIAYQLSDRSLQIVDISACNTCTADLTGDGELNFFDVSAFLSAFNAQDPVADFNADAMYNFFDVSEFLNLFNAGCP